VRKPERRRVSINKPTSGVRRAGLLQAKSVRSPGAAIRKSGLRSRPKLVLGSLGRPLSKVTLGDADDIVGLDRQ
jgi:hypothetical protein